MKFIKSTILVFIFGIVGSVLFSNYPQHQSILNFKGVAIGVAFYFITLTILSIITKKKIKINK